MTSARRAKLDALLEQRVRAHGDLHRTARQVLQQRSARPAGQPSRQQAHAHAERLEPAEEVPRVLLGEQLGRSHDGRLRAVLDGPQRRERRDHGLAGADVALHEPHHRVLVREVPRDFLPDPALRTGELERQASETSFDEVRARGQRPRVVAIGLLAQQPQADLVREQFLERETPLRRVPALVQRGDVGVRWRPVHVAERRLERRQSNRAEHVRRNPVAQAAARELRQRQPRQHAHASLLDAFRRRIHRRQALVRVRLDAGRDLPVLRVHDLEAARAEARFAEAAQAGAARQRRLLRGREMEEAQRQEARAVGDPAEQGAALAEHDLGELDLALR